MHKIAFAYSALLDPLAKFFLEKKRESSGKKQGERKRRTEKKKKRKKEGVKWVGATWRKISSWR